jgi:hypothetical protein
MYTKAEESMKLAKHFHLVLRLKMRESLSPAHNIHVPYGPNIMGIALTRTSQMCCYRSGKFVQDALLELSGSFQKFCTLLCFLFKNEFILQNTFTGLQCNLHCALSQRSNVWASLVFLSGRLRC